MGIEESLQSALFNQDGAKTYLDKLFSREDIEKLKSLIIKERLNREDMKEILYMLTSTESKLLNLGSWDRYVLLKFFVWIREYVKVLELIFDYNDKLEVKANTCIKCKGVFNQINTKETVKLCACEVKTPVLNLTPRTQELFNNTMRLMDHNIKFLVDLYLNIARTTLSLGGSGFFESLKNKFEMMYTGIPQQQQQQQQQPIIMKGGK